MLGESLFLSGPDEQLTLADLKHFHALIRTDPKRANEQRNENESALAAILICNATPEMAKEIYEILKFALTHDDISIPKDFMGILVPMVILPTHLQLECIGLALNKGEEWSFKTDGGPIEKIPLEYLGFAEEELAEEEQKPPSQRDEEVIDTQKRNIVWRKAVHDYLQRELPKFKALSGRFSDSQARSSEDSPLSRVPSTLVAPSRTPSPQASDSPPLSSQHFLFAVRSLVEAHQEYKMTKAQALQENLAGKKEIMGDVTHAVEEDKKSSTRRVPPPPPPKEEKKGFLGLFRKKDKSGSPDKGPTPRR